MQRTCCSFIVLGVLIAVILCGATDWVHQLTHLNRGWSYALILFTSCGLLAAVGYFLGPRVLTQAHDLAATVPKSLLTLQLQLDRYRWGKDVANILNTAMQPAQVAKSFSQYATSLVSAGTAMIVVAAIALFVAANPTIYRKGALQLVPESSRQQTAELLDDLGYTITWWLVGQLIPMALLGIATMLGLWLMGVPLAFTLGLLTAAMLFVPYVGSVIAYIPSALVSLTLGPATLLSVSVLYVAVHLAEGYVITPIVQRRAVEIPPALTLTAQLLMWKFAGLLGVMAATPLTAMSLVLVRKLYLKQPLERRT